MTRHRAGLPSLVSCTPWHYLPRLGDVGTFRDCGAYLGMARDSWVEQLRCPHCRKTGEAHLSAIDEYSWDVRVDSFPEAFKVIRLENGLPKFHCVSCDIPVEL